MQTGSEAPYFAILSPFYHDTIDINFAHKRCSEYNLLSQKAGPNSIQGTTKYWVEEIL